MSLASTEIKFSHQHSMSYANQIKKKHHLSHANQIQKFSFNTNILCPTQVRKLRFHIKILCLTQIKTFHKNIICPTQIKSRYQVVLTTNILCLTQIKLIQKLITTEIKSRYQVFLTTNIICPAQIKHRHFCFNNKHSINFNKFKTTIWFVCARNQCNVMTKDRPSAI
jgi:hypothetical protein